MPDPAQHSSILGSTVSACVAMAGSSAAPARSAAASCMQELLVGTSSLSPAQVGPALLCMAQLLALGSTW